MHNILSLIVESKKRQVEILKKNQDAIISLSKKVPKPLSFKEAIRFENKISLIAEIKQASPSSGILRKDFSPIEIAKTFQKLNVRAISVLTEEEFFLGKLQFISQIKQEVNLPILRK
ncbi:MAG: indole-3-glycerol-phosphate synthase TrpC, partial [Candidatus Omnitrophica bacterium]|nr:indole-3-glycerol-phosphate synthase TrpC [Candidatus Omnitrophota bacterium]